MGFVEKNIKGFLAVWGNFLQCVKKHEQADNRLPPSPSQAYPFATLERVIPPSSRLPS